MSQVQAMSRIPGPAVDSGNNTAMGPGLSKSSGDEPKRSLPFGGLAAIARGALLGMLVCTTAAAVSLPEVRMYPLAAAVAVCLAACQLWLGESAVHNKPVWGWRAALGVDLAALPTVLALRVAIHDHDWTLTTAAAVCIVVWVVTAVALHPSRTEVPA